MYLESSTEVNVAYYKKFGFVENRVISLNRASKPVKLHIMVREPRTEGEASKGGKQAAAPRNH